MKNRILALLFLAIFTFGVHKVYSRLVYAKSSSLHFKLFLKKPLKLQEGTYVYFSFKGNEHYPSGTKFIKEIACTPGRKLSLDESNSWKCDDKFLYNGEYKFKETSLGNPLDIFIFDGVIPADKYFVLGHDPMSYDSKYWGLVDAADIKYTLEPIW